SHYLGAGAVPQFALPYRIVMLAPSAISLLVAPLWPAYAEALARGDRAWAHRTLRRSVAVAVGGTVAVSALLVLAGPALLRRVTGDAAPPSRHLLAALGLLACVISASTAVGVFLSATGRLRIQVVAAGVMCVANLGLSIALIGPLGLAGPAWGTIITQTVCVLIPVSLVIRRTRRAGDDAAPAAMGHAVPAAGAR
ncbi:MAG: polysaccharide biosynthesis protein, partial [Acidimicrobiales bacterium]|nr:polysaccharide biosynthesis protein [Acidimicrobiales bacterium]